MNVSDEAIDKALEDIIIHHKYGDISKVDFRAVEENCQLEIDHQRMLQSAKFSHPLTNQPIRTAEEAEDAKRVADWVYEVRKNNAECERFSERLFMIIGAVFLIGGLIAFIIYEYFKLD